MDAQRCLPPFIPSSIHLSISYLSIYTSIHLFIYPSNLFIYLSAHLYIYPSINPSIHPSVRPMFSCNCIHSITGVPVTCNNVANYSNWLSVMHGFVHPLQSLPGIELSFEAMATIKRQFPKPLLKWNLRRLEDCRWLTCKRSGCSLDIPGS